MKIWIERARRSWVTFWLGQLAVWATVASIGFGVYSVIDMQEGKKARVEESQARKEERKIGYRTILTTPALGNSGKIEALEYLVKQGVSLTSIDLSCRAMHGEEPDTDSDDPKATKCERPVYLEGLDLSKNKLGESANLSSANLSDANLRSANLSDANLFKANLSGVKLRSANLSDANLRSANLSDAKLRSANLSGADLRSADLIDANLNRANLSDADLFKANLSDADLFKANLSDADLSRADLRGADLIDANLSDADFDDATFSDTTFTNAWAWADKPPRNLPATIQIQLCKYNTEGSSGNLGNLGNLGYLRNRRPDPCIPPDTK